MATTSRADAVIDAVVAAVLAEGNDVAVYDVWPGPDARGEMIVFGDIAWDEYEITTIAAGRKKRDELFRVDGEVWIFGGAGANPTNVGPVRERAFALLDHVEDVMADDPTLGTLDGVLWSQIELTEAGARVFEKAWAFRVAFQIVTKARLL